MRNWPAVLAALAPAERAEAVPDLLAAAEKIASAPTAEQIEDACIVDDDFEAEITRWLYDTENYRGAEIVKCLQDDLKVLRQAVVAFDMAVRLDAMPAPPAPAPWTRRGRRCRNECRGPLSHHRPGAH